MLLTLIAIVVPTARPTSPWKRHGQAGTLRFSEAPCSPGSDPSAHRPSFRRAASRRPQPKVGRNTHCQRARRYALCSNLGDEDPYAFILAALLQHLVNRSSPATVGGGQAL